MARPSGASRTWVPFSTMNAVTRTLRQDNADKAYDDFGAALRALLMTCGQTGYRGIGYSSEHKFDAALNDFTQALRLDNNHLESHRQRGLIYAIREDWENADLIFFRGKPSSKSEMFLSVV